MKTEQDNSPPGQHTAAIAAVDFMQSSELGQQNAPVSHVLVPFGQDVAPNDQPPCISIVLVEVGVAELNLRGFTSQRLRSGRMTEAMPKSFSCPLDWLFVQSLSRSGTFLT